MDQAAVTKARKYLDQAEEAFAALGGAESLGEFDKHWAALLDHLNTIHEIIKKGARVNPQSRQWYGNVKSERKRDPFLSYLHQARNAEKHGIGEVISEAPGISMETPTSWTGTVHSVKFTAGNVSGEFPSENGVVKPGTKVVLWKPVLIAVYDDRSDAWHDPPTKHLDYDHGGEMTPEFAAAMGLEYHRRLILVAEAFAK